MAYPQDSQISTGRPAFHLHLVSDSTGETVSAIARACLVQFEGVQVQQHLWWLVRTQGQVERVIAGVEAKPGMVLCTVIDGAIRIMLEDACRRLSVPCISVLDPVMGALSHHLGVGFHAEPGRQHALDAEYFKRIDAMHFTLEHDDGQKLDDLDDADLVLVGVSRTSKTPTCMYLANRGVKAANIPLVPGIDPPPQLLAATRPLIVGITKDPKSLAEIRRHRLLFQKQDENNPYADVDRVKEEVAAARRLFSKHDWPVIDVTRRSIEEASAAILQLYNRRTGRSMQ